MDQENRSRYGADTEQAGEEHFDHFLCRHGTAPLEPGSPAYTPAANKYTRWRWEEVPGLFPQAFCRGFWEELVGVGIVEKVGSCRAAQFPGNAVPVGACCFGADAQQASDLGVGFSLQEQQEDLPFAGGEAVVGEVFR